MVTGSHDGLVKIWDINKQTEISSFKPHAYIISNTFMIYLEKVVFGL